MIDDDSAANSDDRGRQDGENDLEKLLNGPLPLFTPFAKWLIKWSMRSEPGDLHRLAIDTDWHYPTSMRVLLDLDVIMNSLWLLEDGYQVDLARLNENEVGPAASFLTESSIKSATSDDSMISLSRSRRKSNQNRMSNNQTLPDPNKSDTLDSKFDINPSSVSSIPLTRLSHDDTSMKDIESVKSLDSFNIQDQQQEKQNDFQTVNDIDSHSVKNQSDTDRQSVVFHIKTDSSESELYDDKIIKSELKQSIGDNLNSDMETNQQQYNELGEATKHRASINGNTSKTKTEIQAKTKNDQHSKSVQSSSESESAKKLTNNHDDIVLTTSTPLHQPPSTPDTTPFINKSTNNHDGTLFIPNQGDDSNEGKKIMELNDSVNQYPTVIAKKSSNAIHPDENDKRQDLCVKPSSKSDLSVHQNLSHDKDEIITPIHIKTVDQIATDSNSDGNHSSDHQRYHSPQVKKIFSRQHRISRSTPSTSEISNLAVSNIEKEFPTSNSQSLRNKSNRYKKSKLIARRIQNASYPNNGSNSDSSQCDTGKIKAGHSTRNFRYSYQRSRDNNNNNNPQSGPNDRSIDAAVTSHDVSDNNNTAIVNKTFSEQEGDLVFSQSTASITGQSYHVPTAEIPNQNEAKTTPNSIQRVVRDEMIKVLQVLFSLK